MKKLAIVAVLIAVVVFGIVAYASADTTATQTVTVKVTSKPLLTMTVSTNAVDFGSVDPGEVPDAKSVTVTVASNRLYNLQKTGGTDLTMGLTSTLQDHQDKNLAKTAGQAYVDTFNLTMPWTTNPGAYTNSVVYTAAQ